MFHRWEDVRETLHADPGEVAEAMLAMLAEIEGNS